MNFGRCQGEKKIKIEFQNSMNDNTKKEYIRKNKECKIEIIRMGEYNYNSV